MNINSNPLIWATSCVCALALASCNKEADTMDTSIGESAARIDFVDQAVEDPVDAIVLRSDSTDDCLGPCVEITDSGAGVWPRTITLDFGEGCTDGMGRTRAGMLHIEISAPWEEIGSIRSTTFENFSVQGPNALEPTSVEGIRSLERLENGTEGEPRWARSVETTMTRSDWSVTHEFNGIRRWIQGWDDTELDPWMGLTGSGSWTRSNGMQKTRNILEELVRSGDCGEVISGVVEIAWPMNEALLDFGSGACDGEATITIDGVTETIQI